MNRLLKNILKFTIVPAALFGGVVFASEPQVIGSIFAVTQEGIEPLTEYVFGTLEDCWAAAAAFNAETVGKGMMAVCWPYFDPNTLGV